MYLRMSCQRTFEATAGIGSCTCSELDADRTLSFSWKGMPEADQADAVMTSSAAR